MRFTEEFVVARPPREVWEFFKDVPAVADCMPGAELGEQKEDGTYEGTIGIRLGPLSLGFQGRAEVEWDDEELAGRITAQATDRKGGSRAQAQVDYRLEEVEDGTKVVMDIDLSLSGAAAQFGRTGLIKQVSGRMTGQFARCLEEKLTS